ncbi:alpha/beta hydrolase [Luedemannella helvata]|uniref:Alpha/beta fold hydrolase n=1 Tax=Luedemannella helvata TaxID=349315 RepID=A0ABN2KTE0_9ACTN
MAELRTADGVVLSAQHDPGPSTDLAFVAAHGFTGSWRTPAMRRVAAILTEFGGVVTFDFRGHGRSGGASTVGDQEIYDVAAAVDWARSLGYASVATVGFSLGSACVVRHAAAFPADFLVGVAAVSGPSRWYYRDTVPMRRLHWVVERRLGRVVSRVALRTRVSAVAWPADQLPESPTEAAARLAPVPLLVVHGDADRYFPLDHAHALHAAAGQTSELWIEPGFGHAENAASDDLIRRIGGWLARAAASARPPRPSGGPPS